MKRVVGPTFRSGGQSSSRRALFGQLLEISCLGLFDGSPVPFRIDERIGRGLGFQRLELGGHAPVLVFDDADPVAAGKACAAAKFRNNGQVCISPSRFYVHSSIKEAFSAAMVEGARVLKLGSGVDPQVTCGPMINVRGRERVEALVQDAVKRGAQVLAGGAGLAKRTTCTTAGAGR